MWTRACPESIETDGTLVWRILMNYVTNALKAAVRPGAEQGRGVDVRNISGEGERARHLTAQDLRDVVMSSGRDRRSEARRPLANEEIATDVVGLAPTARPEEWLKIEVEDSGPGVDAALRHRLFNAFVQAQGHEGGDRPRVYLRSNNAPPSYQARVGRASRTTTTRPRGPGLGMLEPKFDQEDSGEGTGSAWTLVPLQLPNSEPAQKVEGVPETPVEVTRSIGNGAHRRAGVSGPSVDCGR